jgi:mevalonate kinase
MALSVPYNLFSGKLEFQTKNTGVIDLELKAFAQYLKKQQAANFLSCHFDTTSFEFDIGQGLYFNSTIPQGFGVGSSGALCASLFERYCDDKDSKTNINELKAIFAQLESHFHGSSSGIDPLIIYLNKPTLIREGNDLGAVTLPNYKKGKGGIFLLNSGRARRTEPLVNLFLEKCKNDPFDQLCQNVLLPITNNCINSFLEGDTASLYEFFRDLSDFQFRHFNPMIPQLCQDIWEKGLKYENYYLKLCGAGGGGFLLGMTANFDDVQEQLGQYEIRSILRF